VKIAAAEISHIFFTVGMIQITFPVLLVVIYAPEIDVSVRKGDLHFSYQVAIVPFAFEFLGVWKN
jgi:hypothetical protein